MPLVDLKSITQFDLFDGWFIEKIDRMMETAKEESTRDPDHDCDRFRRFSYPEREKESSLISIFMSAFS